jgi:hypothetical protein
MSKKKQPSSSLAEAIRVLREYESELNAIYGLGTQSPLERAAKSECQERLRELKARFKNDIAAYKERLAATPDDYAIDTLVSTLKEASARINVRWDADPQTTREWAADLYSARTDISHYLNLLEKDEEAGE